jgi:hypothetical protein
LGRQPRDPYRTGYEIRAAMGIAKRETEAGNAAFTNMLLDARHIDGRALRHLRDTPGEDKPCCDGAALGESAGALSTCRIAYVTELVGAEAEPEKPPLETAP